MRIFETLRAYEQTAALRAAVELDIFTAIGEGATTAADLAAKRSASERGVRILCDYLATDGLLIKNNGHYACSPDATVFLDRRSPACIASATEFLAGNDNITTSLSLADCVRKGGTVLPGEGSVEPDNPFWVLFARAMAPIMGIAAQAIAEQISGTGPLKVLDIAAGHGVFGIAIAQKNPQAEITALDWAAVLDVAKENAAKAGVSNRHNLLPGSAFDVDFGSGYDIILLTNFLHHFDQPTIEHFLRKVHRTLKPGGKAVTLEFCPNEDRVTPLSPARFVLTMLLSTAHGDAYTFNQLDSMFRTAGFGPSQHQRLPSDQSVIVSPK
jgi:hypothetical protein